MRLTVYGSVGARIRFPTDQNNPAPQDGDGLVPRRAAQKVDQVGAVAGAGDPLHRHL